MPLSPIRAALKSQYIAALKTMQQTIENCPEKVWTDSRYHNPYWQVAYHGLYYAHLYLEENLDAFEPWENDRPGYHDLGNPPPNAVPYTKGELLNYCAYCLEKAERAMELLDLEQPESGFYWYQMPKLEHQIVNIRHIQHHAAQLADRLRNAEGAGTKWIRGN